MIITSKTSAQILYIYIERDREQYIREENYFTREHIKL